MSHDALSWPLELLLDAVLASGIPPIHLQLLEMTVSQATPSQLSQDDLPCRVHGI